MRKKISEMQGGGGDVDKPTFRYSIRNWTDRRPAKCNNGQRVQHEQKFWTPLLHTLV